MLQRTLNQQDTAVKCSSLNLVSSSPKSALQGGTFSNAEDQGYNLPGLPHDIGIPNATTCVEADILFPGKPLAGAL